MPHTGLFHWQAVGACLRMLLPPGTTWHLLGHALIHDAREIMAEEMLRDGLDWILMMDSDMIVPANTVQRLLAHNKPIVGTVAFKRYPPHQPCVYDRFRVDGDRIELRYMRDWPKGLIEVEGVGAACLLIRRKVFEQVPRPWFFPVLPAGPGGRVQDPR